MKTKMTYLSSGIVGLAGLALMGIQANEAQAATTGTVNYQTVLQLFGQVLKLVKNLHVT